MDISRLRDAVEAAFQVTGATTPAWADPHGGNPEPREEEYSRCLDPGKYRIVSARADAWVDALDGLGLARSREVPVTGLWRVEQDRVTPDRAVVLEPRQVTPLTAPTGDGPLPVLLAYWEPTEHGAALVRVGAGLPSVEVGRSPDCGCDACDFGSDGHLAELDAAVEAVVTGDFLHVRTPRLTVSSTMGSTAASGHDLDRHEAARVLDEARAGRSPHLVLRARPWW